MIASMTGFGEARHEADGHAYLVEVRSVNNRFLKTSIRLPEEFAFLEAPLERLIRERLTRGSITLRLHLRDLSAAAAQDLNVAAIRRYVEQLRAAAADAQADVTINLASLTSLPGVCQPHELSETARDEQSALIEQLAGQALAALTEMRKTEGQALAEDLSKHTATMRERVAAIRTRAPLVVDEYRKRLMTRIEHLLAGSNVQLAQDDVVKEVAVYAERSDVAEELSRLGSHLDQFEACIAGGEPAGRKLDFIAQEMLREANTIGSKAGDAQIARDVIELKSTIDRIKEQVQNVE